MTTQVAYISEPTWGNHKNIFGDERVEWRTYRYFDPKTVGLDFDGARPPPLSLAQRRSSPKPRAHADAAFAPAAPHTQA